MTLKMQELFDLEKRMTELASHNERDKLLQVLLKVFKDNSKIVLMINDVLNAPLKSGQTRLDCFTERLDAAKEKP